MTYTEDILCPVCHNERGTLVERARTIINSPFSRVMDVKVVCKVCPYQEHVRYTTPEIEQINERIKNIARLQNNHIATHGVANERYEHRLEIVKENRTIAIERMKSMIKNELSR